MSPAVCLVTLLLLNLTATVWSAANNTNNTSLRSKNETDAVDLFDQLTRRSDSRVRPGVYGPPTNVSIDFFVQTFGPLNEVEMDFSTDLDFRGTWFDPRLAFSSETDDPVYIPYRDIDRFWIPDLYFPNEKSGKAHEITIPNKSIRIYPNGTVRYFTRMAMRLSCTMYLDKFPLDYQICFIKISTYSYDSKEVVLNWFDEKPIEIHENELQLPQFILVNYTPEACIEAYKTGNYSCLQATFFLKRLVGFFVLQTYIPSILIVVLSWVAFWINKDSEPARIALGVTTVLTMTTQLTTSRSNTMRVSYLKAIDVWYSACMLFVFAALLEYAFVNASSRSERNKERRAKKFDATDDVELQMLNDPEGKAIHDDSLEGPASSLNSKPVTWSRRFDGFKSWVCVSKNIDWVSRRVFPSTFGLFNLIYWSVYLSPPYYHCHISSSQFLESCIESPISALSVDM